MKLTLNHFQCWDHLTLSWPENHIVLLKGVSGSGKTTILRAIEWVLYGEMKHIAPSHNLTAKTSVEFILPNMTIKRMKKKLTVNHLTDETAQEYINQAFGTLPIWLSSCYYQQLSHNYFLLAPNTEKITLLNQLSFQDDLPEAYLTKINTELDKVKTIYDYKKKHWKWTDFKVEDIHLITDVNELTEKLKISQVRLEELKKIHTRRQIYLPLKIKQEETLTACQLQLTQLVNVDTDIVSLEEQLIKWNRYNVLMAELPSEVPFTPYTQEDYDTALKMELLYPEALLKKLNLPLDQVEEYKKELKYQLSIQPTLKLQQEQLKLKSQLVPLINYQNDINQLQADITQHQNDINHLKQQLQPAMPCPHCDQLVIYNQGQLIRKIDVANVTNELKSVESDLIALNHKKLELDKKQVLYHQQIILQRQVTERLKEIGDISPVNGHLLTDKEIESGTKILYQLERMVAPPPIPSLDIKRHLINQDNHYKRLAILEELKGVSVEDPNEKIKLGKLKLELLKKIDVTPIIVENDPSEEIIQLDKIINTCQQQLQEYKINLNLKQQQDCYHQDHEELMLIYNKMVDLEELKKHAIWVECQMLENKVAILNYHLYDIMQKMFDCSIKMELGLFKMVNKQLKSQVNFNILYKGGQFDHITRMSGGEADRASLAFTLALNQLSSCSLMMFDESVKFLNPELKIKILEIMKEYCHCTVLLVDHEGLEGIVDTIINVDEL